MKKILLLMVTAFISVTSLNAQYTVALVNADYNGDEIAKVITAMDKLDNANFTYTKFDTISNYSEIKDFNMVLFYKGNDGICKDMWVKADGEPLAMVDSYKQYVDAGGVLWLDGLDLLYGAYGSAPDDFVAGDIMYDIFGISKYASQSKADDGSIGISDYTRAPDATFLSVEKVEWQYSTLWYADGLEITADAHALYLMGGDADYPLKGQVSALYKENAIFSGLRLGKLKNQDDVDAIILDMLTEAKKGTFAKAPLAIGNNELASFGIYPNPAANGFVTIQAQNSELLSSVEVFNTLGESVRSISVENQSQITVGVSELTEGIYFIRATTDRGVATQKLLVK